MIYLRVKHQEVSDLNGLSSGDQERLGDKGVTWLVAEAPPSEQSVQRLSLIKKLIIKKD